MKQIIKLKTENRGEANSFAVQSIFIKKYKQKRNFFIT